MVVTSQDNLPHQVFVDGSVTDAVVAYEVVVTGTIEPETATSSAGGDVWDEHDDDGSKVHGVVNQGVDGFSYSGEITTIAVDGTAEVTIENAR